MANEQPRQTNRVSRRTGRRFCQPFAVVGFILLYGYTKYSIGFYRRLALSVTPSIPDGEVSWLRSADADQVASPQSPVTTINTVKETKEMTKSHLVVCTKIEEFLRPIVKYFEIHRLFDGYNGVPPWNATVLLLVDNHLCKDHPYVKASFRRRLESPFVDTSTHANELDGKWKNGVYFPHASTKKFMRVIKDRPALIRARGEVFWRNTDIHCQEVDFVWARYVENPSNECFTVHYLQGVSSSYSRTKEMGYNQTTAIYEGKAMHPQRDNATTYEKFCSFLIRADPGSLVEMFQEKNYDIDAIVRHMFFKQIGEYRPCERVTECPGNPDTAYECFNGYKFHITMENSLVDGYVSEKVFNGALGSGIPIYFGAPDIGSYVNIKSILHCNINRTIIEEMRSFFPRTLKEKRIFMLNGTSYWPTEDELIRWADGYLRKELEPCIQRVIELDNNDTAFREIIRQPFITSSDVMNGMYPLRGVRLAHDALRE